MTTLADLTTLRVGGPIAEYVRVSTTDSLLEAVRAADASGGPLLVVGGGSNLLASDAPFEGTVVDVSPFGELASIIDEGPSGSVLVRAGAGTVWDEFVSWTLSQGLSGVEALSGIPGTVGASPVQNVGAYGHEVAETISSVEAYDRLTGDVVRLMPAELGFAYRSSAIKRSVGQPGLHDSPWGPTGRWVVLSVDFRLERSPLSAPSCIPSWLAASASRPGRVPTLPGPLHRPGSAPRQGHGPRLCRPRHVERRFILHEPDPVRGRCRRPA